MKKYLKPCIAVVVLPLLLSTILMGCAAKKNSQYVDVPEEEMNAYLADKPVALHDDYRMVLLEGERNFVLNHLKAGLKAFRIGEYDTAEYSFDQALAAIETVYSNEENAKMAKSVWHEEGMKDFKGEPYERAMAYFFRGVLYLFDGDYENARACFKQGNIQDTMTEEIQEETPEGEEETVVEVKPGDYTMLYILEGWTSLALGDTELAKDAFNKVREIPGMENFQDIPEDHDSIVLVGTGHSPQKLAEGKYGENLSMQRNPMNCIMDVYIATPETVIEECTTEDIYFQAARGDRAMDEVLQDKVTVKDNTAAVGQVMQTAGTTTALAGSLSGNRNTALIGAALALFGSIAKASSANMTPKADTRTWLGLPDKVYVYTLNHKDAEGVELVLVTDTGEEGRTELQVRELPGPRYFAWSRIQDVAPEMMQTAADTTSEPAPAQ